MYEPAVGHLGMTGQRYLEDLAVGEITKTRSIKVTQAEVIDFALRYDPQFMHTDPQAALHGPFNGLIASGWHTAALVMRLMVDAQPLGDAPLVGLGVDALRWPKPVRAGDTIEAQIEVASIQRSHSKPDYGIVRLNITARNQHGEIVLTMTPSAWVPRRSV